MVAGFFFELGALIVFAVLVTGILRFLRQPLIIGYIATGIVVSPYLLDVVRSQDVLAGFSEIGVAFLLFMVGLNLNPRIIRDVGKTSLLVGLGQIVFTALLSFSLSLVIGFGLLASVYLAAALTFSSTIIVLKLLSDRRDTETLYGKIAMGVLIVQDIVVMILLLVLSSFKNAEGSLLALAIESTLKGFGALLALFLLTWYVFPGLIKRIAKSQEFLFLFSIGWCFFLSAVFYFLDFSIEIGALLAGVSLAASPYHFEISSRMKPLRDFFLVLFFVFLGSQLVFTNFAAQILPLVVFTFFALVVKPLIVISLLGFLGYTKRTSFLTGVSLAQISEFSLILVAFGASAGHLTGDVLAFVTIIGLITITGSSYMILYSTWLYKQLAPYLAFFERKHVTLKRKKKTDEQYDIVLFGYSKFGFDLLRSFRKLKSKFLVVDFDPEVISMLHERKISCMFGDAEDLELLHELKLEKTRMFISTIHTVSINLFLLRYLRRMNKRSIVIVVSHHIDDALELYKNGASYVIMPHVLGGKHASELVLQHGMNPKRFLREKEAHVKHLYRQREGML